MRALDGELAGTRKIPRTEINAGNTGGQDIKSYSPLGDSCPIALGRNLLFWRLEQNRHVLELFDPWTQKSVWPRREFSFHAQYSILGNELIGILEPKGEFVLLNLADGRPIADVDLKAAAVSSRANADGMGKSIPGIGTRFVPGSERSPVASVAALRHSFETDFKRSHICHRPERETSLARAGRNQGSAVFDKPAAGPARSVVCMPEIRAKTKFTQPRFVIRTGYRQTIRPDDL